ncbi:MAG: hypothetical protein HDT21_01770, partial [Ruminococcus sp.]|nr:hypothetical protein [Ruminococcus sp.]
AVVFAPPRNAFAFLTSCSVSEAMRLRARGGDFALCGARPGALPRGPRHL